jgi:hypothetical protein
MSFGIVFCDQCSKRTPVFQQGFYTGQLRKPERTWTIYAPLYWLGTKRASARQPAARLSKRTAWRDLLRCAAQPYRVRRLQ